jgi:hypothetical protein
MTSNIENVISQQPPNIRFTLMGPNQTKLKNGGNFQSCPRISKLGMRPKNMRIPHQKKYPGSSTPHYAIFGQTKDNIFKGCPTVPKLCRQLPRKISAHVHGGQSIGSSVSRPGIEDPIGVSGNSFLPFLLDLILRPH